MDRARELTLEHPGWCANVVAHARVRPGERVLVVVDEPLVEEGAQLAAAVADAGGLPHVGLWAGERPLRAVPSAIARAAAESPVYVFLSQAPRGDEADARFELAEISREHGGRAIYMGFVDGALLRDELSGAVPELEAPARGLLARLEGSRSLRLRGAAGTDLSLVVEGRPWLSDALPLAPGEFANHPPGEVYAAPLRDGADGVLVADLTVPYTVEGLVDEPVVLRFASGRVTSIEGGRAASLLRELVERAGAGADVVAEVGIGVNPGVRPRGHVMLDEKAAGTAHVAIGRNTGSYGGDNEAAIHVDLVFSAPTLEADGRPVALP